MVDASRMGSILSLMGAYMLKRTKISYLTTVDNLELNIYVQQTTGISIFQRKIGKKRPNPKYGNLIINLCKDSDIFIGKIELFAYRKFISNLNYIENKKYKNNCRGFR